MFTLEDLQRLLRTGMGAGGIALIGQGQADKIGKPLLVIDHHHALHLCHAANSGKINSKHAPQINRIILILHIYPSRLKGRLI